MSVLIRNRGGNFTVIHNYNKIVVDFVNTERYSLIHKVFNNNKEYELIFKELIFLYVESFSNKNKLLLSAFFNDLNCEDYKLHQYILNDLENVYGIFEINTHTNEFKKEICHTISLKNISLSVSINKKDIDGCNSVDEYLRLIDLKKKINNF